MKHYSSTDGPVVVIDKESFHDIQKQAHLNKELIEQAALKKYAELAADKGLDIKIHINDNAKLVYDNTPVIGMDNWEEISFNPPTAKGIIDNIKSKMVYDIVHIANSALSGRRQSIVNEVKRNWRGLIKERNTWKWLSLIFASAFFASIVVNIYIIYR